VSRWPSELSRLHHGLRALRLVWEAAPGQTAAWAALLLVQGLVPGAIVYVTKWVVDAVAAAVGGGVGPGEVASVVQPAAVMAGLLLVERLAGGLSGYLQASQGERVQDHMKRLIHAKASAVDYAFYESDDYHDKLQDANVQAGSRALGLLQSLGSLARNGVAFASIAAILATYALWLPAALVVATAPVLLVVVRHNRTYRAWWNGTMRDRRRAQYFDMVLTYPESTAEVRLYGFGPEMARTYQDVRGELREGRLGLLRRQTAAGFGAALLGLLAIGGVMGWMGWRALNGRATLGDLALFYQAVNQGQGLSQSILTGFGQSYTNALFLEHFFSFLDLRPKLADPADPAPPPARVTEGVRFENVTFRYPGAERPSVEGLNLEIPAGRVTAIVGMNGAGKSTLVKLLLRFYDPEEGRVLVDGRDVRTFARRDLLDLVSVLFQDPVKYQASARTNVQLADLEAPDAAVEAAVRDAGAADFLDRLPKGLDTTLGRLFYEGGELSGGQWQRVALARAYLRDAPIVVLDEPTSAMDSWSEMAWFDRFQDLARGRTAAIITHRFTVAMQADVIHVMAGGRIVESGTHRDLVALGGRYAESWGAQTRRAQAAGAPKPGAVLERRPVSE